MSLRCELTSNTNIGARSDIRTIELESEVKELKEELRQTKKIARKNFLLQWVLSHELGAACDDSINALQGK